MSKVCIIGAGFSGMSAAAYLSAAGHDVHVFEKNESAGGRARSFSTKNGYTFDMGPSWYWMPDIFEKFFGDFNKTPADYYSLELLTPAFDVVFSEKDTISVPANYIALQNLFEQIEKGAGEKL
ncbi:MAG: oleate hydratase, partial [Bacteroidota bacterium]